MPCFLAGESQGRAAGRRPWGAVFCLLPPAGAPGGGGLVRRADGPAGRSLPGLAPVRRHHRAAAGPAPGDQCGGGEAGRDQRHLRWPAHRPHRRPAGASVPSWQSAGRALSSGGCLYGVPREAEGPHVLPVRDGESGEETAGGGRGPGQRGRFTLDTVCSVVLRATQEAQRRCPGLPVLCSGGVASNRQLRAAMERSCGALFAQPCYSTDNAMGVAILTRRALEGGELA